MNYLTVSELETELKKLLPALIAAPDVSNHHMAEFESWARLVLDGGIDEPMPKKGWPTRGYGVAQRRTTDMIGKFQQWHTPHWCAVQCYVALCDATYRNEVPSSQLSMLDSTGDAGRAVVTTNPDLFHPLIVASAQLRSASEKLERLLSSTHR